ncbi:TPA: hypothetical protein ACJTOG_004593, partial [Klebsiella aerogenes]
RKAQSEDWAFCFGVLRPDAPPSPPVALGLPGLPTRSPEKVRSTASGESRCHSNVNKRLSRKTGPFVFVFCGQTRRQLPGGAALTGATNP